MKKIFLLLLAVSMLPAFLQASHAQNIEGQIVAAQFGAFEVPSVGTGFSFPPASCQIAGGGKNFNAFTTGVPVKIVDTNPTHTEVVTPVAAFVTNSTCSVSITPTYTHTSFSLTSGTGGLQEAINYGQVYGTANTIILDQQWYAQITPRSAATVIGSVAGNTTLGLVDVTTSPYTNYTWNGSQYVATGSGGGGSLPSGTGIVKVVNGNGQLAAPAVDYLYPGSTGTISVTDPTFGALCNWNGSTGTDDTSAFNAAAAAAHAKYVATGAPQTVIVPFGCTLGTGAGNPTITVPSGVYFQGPGSIFVPAQSTNALFQMTSTDDNAFYGLRIVYVSNLSGCAPTVNNDLCIAIRYDSASPGTGITHHNVFVRDDVILNSGWGVLIGPQAGTDLLDRILITNNTIGQTGTGPITSYQFNDGIHVGGAVSSFVIADNIITGRSDAGVAISSEMSTVPRLCHDGSITGNTLFQDRVGIDNSGCSNLTITGNQVYANIPVGNSNPAFRSIYYAGQLPTNVVVNGNTFHNDETLAGSDVSAKFDCFGGCGNGSGTVYMMNSSFTGNKLQSFYADGSEINISDNLFEDNAGYNSGTGIGQNSITINWDTVNVNGSYYVTIGPNNWQYRGQISVANRSDIYFQDVLYPQNSTNGQLTITNGQNFAVPQLSAFYSYMVPSGGQYGWSTQTPGATSASVVACLLSSGQVAFETAAACGNALANATAPIAVGQIYDNGLTVGNCVQAGATSSSPVTTSGFPCSSTAPVPTTIGTAGGNTYFVDNVNGVDSNAGTNPALPWKTIAKVNGFSFGSGSQVLFLAGDVWHEQLTVPSSGVSFGAYGPQRSCTLDASLVAHCINMPIIDGADVITGWAVYSGANYRAAYTSTASKGFVDSLYAQQTPLALQTSIANVTSTAGSIFSDGTYVYVHLLDGSNPANHVVEVSGSRSYGINLGGASTVTISGLEIIRTAKSAIIAYNGASPGNSNIITANVLFNIGDTLGDPAIGLGANAGEGAVYGQQYGSSMTGYKVTNNSFGRMDFTPSTLSSTQAVINFIQSIGTVVNGNTFASVNGTAIQMTDGFNTPLNLCTTPTISNNTITNSQGGITISGCAGAVITQNVDHDSFGNMIEIGGGVQAGNQNNTGAYLTGNRMWNLGSAYSNGLYNGIDINHATNGIATGNFCQHVANDCMTLEADSAASSGWQVYGNTFDASQNTFVDGTACTSSNRCFSMYVRDTSLSGGLTMRANTMVGNAATGFLVRFGATSSSDSTHDLTQAIFDASYPGDEIRGAIGNFTQVNVGSSAPTACSATTGCVALAESGTAGTPAAGVDYLRADSTVHNFKFSLNGGSELVLPTAPTFPVNSQTATYQVLTADFASCKTITVPSGTFTITLVASGSQPTTGQCVYVINYGTGVVTIARSGQNINGGTSSLTLAAGSATAPTGAYIVSDGTNYEAALWGGSSGGSLPSSSAGQTYANVGGTPAATSAITVQSASAGSPIGLNGSTFQNASGPATSTTLSASCASGATTCTITSATGYPPSGTIFASNTGGAQWEFINFTYPGTGTTLTLTARGQYGGGGTGTSLSSGDAVQFVEGIASISTSAVPYYLAMSSTTSNAPSIVLNASTSTFSGSYLNAAGVVVGSGGSGSLLANAYAIQSYGSMQNSGSAVIFQNGSGVSNWGVDTNGVTAVETQTINSAGTSITQTGGVIFFTGTVQSALATLTPSSICTAGIGGSGSSACEVDILGVGATTTTGGNFFAAYTFPANTLGRCRYVLTATPTANKWYCHV